ncbi:protein SSUH2 homolog isoform X1 [Sceloporus undulatus]|uniref:protein SSUH2 homolog isoform X1 n=1 Tax=Sceloporus undulatus TaxID=8520 RepID=UPI001C4C9BD4|nr:protein SSUH2 homolog isoform X1 [Sceloporus undulatus]
MLPEGGHSYSSPNVIPVSEGEPHTTQRNWNVTNISEYVAKEAFAKYTESKCCYSKDPAREMVICDLKSFNTYRYRLETFSELRSCKWKSEPYKGQSVNLSLCTEAPYPWDVPVEVSPMFKDQKTKVKVPCTSSIEVCRRCRGRCINSCSSCNGTGFVTSTTGDHQTSTSCSFCGGSGEERCSMCSGKGKLLTYLQLKVKWKNHIFEYVMDHGFGFPIKRFKKCHGQNILFDEQHMVSPVVDFPENTIKKVSQTAVQQHQAKFITPIRGQVHSPDHGIATWNAISCPRVKFPPTMSIRKQKQIVELLYLTRVEYEWHGKPYSYYVYGNENKVYAEYYPKKCCCTVM